MMVDAMPLPTPSQDTVNILLVDDQPKNLIVLEGLLEQPGRELLRATSGNEALRFLLKHEVALALLDVEMPGMDGYEVAQLMRSREQTRLIPIIFVTAGDRSEERQFRGYEAGAVDFLYKPINAHTLTSKVNVFIDLFRKTRELARVNAALEHATAALREKIADLEDVSHTLGHDLRAPLRSIRGFSQILAEELGDKVDGDAKRALERVMQGGERMTKMLDGLYSLLRVSSAERGSADVDTAAVFRDVVENLRGDLAAAGATVTSDALPRVRGNTVLIGQILQNLIANGVKFRGAEAPAIHVGAERIADAWQFSVRDNGPGIAPDDRARVFKLYERISSASAGTGVGLALCRRAVEKLGGTIWVGDNAAPGATFYFTVPDPAPR
jgi:two-component system, sensor histidine kinase and response regulator